MRKAFIQSLEKLAKSDKNIILLTGDVGFSYFEQFQKKFPNQFLNCGIIEQSMMGVASGMALAGGKPWVYSMIPFSIMRCYEQLRNDVCYQNLNVKIIGVRGSKHYKFLGFTHNLLGKENEEDLLKNLPNLKRYYPKNPNMVKKIIIEENKRKGPCYIRL